ncbi:uncharacterized protein LOC112572036 isoform X2 [Pomacea canaliculata]|uniref:uncharacterized protein LOC112572036 isoform X2 n=1 Tax=Pomacea canaliculata TaxID=400727 RepID=UPI000D7362B5|nr:uncharacterized protein LOC112572036 isoform X2 [Pomacea canaliculata]
MAGEECGDPGTHPGISSHSTPLSYHSLHWSRHLKCQVCFGYLRKPVTLCCGHSFCRLCVIQLGQTTKALNPTVSLRFLKVSCPTCRTIFPASSILKGRVPASFLLQNLLADWRRERRRTVVNRQCRLLQRKDSAQETQNLQEEFHLRWRPDEDYCKAMMSDINSESSDEAEQKAGDDADNRQDASSCETDSSSSSAVSSTRGVQLGGRRSRHRGAALRFRGSGRDCSEWSPARVLLMSIWCMYSMVVVGLAQSMLPYMVLVTLLFLLVILK